MSEEGLPPAGVLDFSARMAEVIASFRPVSNPPAWKRIGAVVREIATRSRPRDVQTARLVLNHVTRLAMFADDEGYSLTVRVLLTKKMIDTYCAKSCDHLAPGTVASYRRAFLQIRAAVVGGGGVTGALNDTASYQPYSQAERAALWDLSTGQRSEQLKSGLQTLLALGMGCGLSPAEAAAVQPGDLRRAADGAGAVTVVVRGRGQRLVVCRGAWEQVLWEHGRGLAGQPALLLPGRVKRRGAGLVTGLLNELEDAPDTPRVQMSRLRASWLMDLVDVRTPLPTIVAAAGPDALKLLGRLLPHMHSPDEDEARRLLRGQ